MFRENYKLLPTPKTTGYQCDMLMAYPNAAIEYTTQGCVVTLCFCVKSNAAEELKKVGCYYDFRKENYLCNILTICLLRS